MRDDEGTEDLAPQDLREAQRMQDQRQRLRFRSRAAAIASSVQNDFSAGPLLARPPTAEEFSAVRSSLSEA